MRKYLGWMAMAAMLTFLPGLTQAQATRFDVFGGAILGSPTGFLGGGDLVFPINRNFSFVPSAAVGRSGHTGLFTLDGTFRYAFHPDDQAFVPYVLGGVGMAQWGSATHGSAIIGVGARFPVGHGVWIVPEVRAASHGLARFTIGFSKSF
ncbi:MAG: hypothetical protein ACRD1C_01815 [Terriglobales bacterium]